VKSIASSFCKAATTTDLATANVDFEGFPVVGEGQNAATRQNPPGRSDAG